MCAIDRQLIMDTCLGDSGGPLQIKLLGNAKMNPFLIGVTSFGKACADHTPGVYTKIAAYIDWIESVTQIETDPKKCAYKYQKYREFEPDVVTKHGDKENINTDRAHIDTNPGHVEYLVKVGWSQGNNVDWRCNGALITEKFVLTSASCLKLNGKNPDKIMTSGDSDNIFQAHQITFHPNFVSSGVDNDISLIELKNEVTFSDDVRPACFYSRDEIPNHVELGLLGLGYRQSLSIFSSLAYNENPSKELVISRSSPMNNTFCSKFYELDGIQLNEERQVCYGNIDYYLIPDACQIALGAPLAREFWTSDRYHSFIVGLPMHGNDCGFGFPAIATKISHYIDWIDSVIFKNTPQNSCILPNGVKSSCKRASECPHLVQQIKEGKSKLMDYICRFDDNRDPLVCCPKINQKYDFESCPQKNLQLRRRWNEIEQQNQIDDEYAHLALIGYEATKEWHCRGNLITDKHVLSSSECVNSDSKYDAVALGNVEKILYRIINVVTNDNLLSLITLDSSVSVSKNIIPICLWLDKDRIPFIRNSIVSKVNEPLFAESVRPHPSSECQGYSNSIKNNEKSCISFFRDSICTSPGTGIQAMKNESGLIVPYLVGQLYDVNKINCPNDDDDELFYQFTKIAYNVDWILDNI
uniref:CSON009918 protein n=1 Tax=Culicoides sonorensis TaxID=179676 RepID=A0A336N0F4_CULSO